MLLVDLTLVDLAQPDVTHIGTGGGPGAPAEDQQVGERISTQSIGPVQSGRCLAGRVEPGKRGDSGLGLDAQPAHGVVNRRRDLHGVLRDVDVGELQKLLVHRREFFLDFVRTEMPHVEIGAAVLGAATGLDFFVDRARHDVTRGEFLLFGIVLEHEALALAVREVAALAAHGLRHQDAANTGRPDHAGGMELNHLGVEDLGPSVETHSDAVAGALPGV